MNLFKVYFPIGWQKMQKYDTNQLYHYLHCEYSFKYCPSGPMTNLLYYLHITISSKSCPEGIFVPSCTSELGAIKAQFQLQKCISQTYTTPRQRFLWLWFRLDRPIHFGVLAI